MEFQWKFGFKTKEKKDPSPYLVPTPLIEGVWRLCSLNFISNFFHVFGN